MPSYDVAVLGAGPGGYTAAIRAAERGAKTCVIESGFVGGCCLNVGCIPTKAMLHAGEVYRHIIRASEYGFAVGEASVDGAAYMGRVAQVVTGLRKGVEKLLKFRKIEVIRGRGRLTARDTIRIETEAGPQDVAAKAIILATGSRPARPGFLPWDSGKVLTTDEATAAKDLPKSILIVGGGVIGCEFATAYAELGIPTTLVEMLDRLVANIDAEAAKAITKSLEQRGVRILVGSKIAGMKASEAGVMADIEGGKAVEAACALVATGRAPNTQDLGLEALGIEMSGKVIKVDDRCATSVPGVYAIGDVAETRQYAHLASRMGIVAAENATGHAARDPRNVLPVGIYTHPEIAGVGLSEEEALKSDAKVRVSRFFYQGSGMARAYGDAEGQVKIIAAEGTGEILGALVIGQHATDVIQEISLAMRHELTVEEIAETIHPHPTFVEGVLEAAEAWTGFPTHAAG